MHASILKANVAVDAQALKRHQDLRNELFKNLKSAATEYTFNHLVIYLPAGSLPGVNVRVPVSHVRYSSTVFFAFDRFTLEPGAERVLLELAQTLLKDKAFRSLLVVGHTDSIGADEYNSTLSLNRAVTVANKLREAGVREDLLGVIPMGEAQPFSTNSTTKGRAQNRRVEFFISDIPEATTKAIERIWFNPCHRNDHELGNGTIGTDCDPTEQRIPVYAGSSGRGTPRIMLDLGRAALAARDSNPTMRPVVPQILLQRPSLQELQPQ